MGDLFVSAPFLFIGGGIAVLVVGIIVWSFYREKKRTEGMKAVADRMGLPFYPKGDPALISELSSFHLFSQGRSRRISNMIHGDTEDVEVGIFDYQYTTGSGKNSHTWRQTVIYFRSVQLSLPHFALRPEHLFHKIGAAFGYRDIDFESHPAFSSNYLLRGSHEPQIRKAFTDDVLSYFEQQRGASVEASGPQLIYFRAANRIQPEQVRSFMEEGFRVFALFRPRDS